MVELMQQKRVALIYFLVEVMNEEDKDFADEKGKLK